MDDAMQSSLSGISGILVAPFDADDRFDPAPLGPIIDRAVGAGVHLLVANGNTGEFYGLRPAEAEAMVHATTEKVGGRVPVVGGVGRSVHEACDLARASRAAGASALMVHQPPDPFAAPRGVLAYVERVAEAAQGLPLIVYLRNDTIGIDTIARLCAVETVVAVKWATPNVLTLARARSEARHDITWICGLAETWAPPMAAVGARGFTSGLINVWPERSVAIHAALEHGDYERAGKLINDIAGFEALRAQEHNGTNVSVVKAALAMRGTDCGPCRPPSAWPLDDAQHGQLRAILAAWDA
ncbi:MULTISPECIES: dihydrodipicolinate synthase family protein [unclassified Roseitalea]|uniref:dihydrodipicolinate synthase family protein n=1 Tax=unclassified Roseitalea TaxID=2639107 RepID=UPI0027400B9D|nr:MULTISPECIES: dihydrodipicolinate synthase family protein [unclassified Roseitalea]